MLFQTFLPSVVKSLTRRFCCSLLHCKKTPSWCKKLPVCSLSSLAWSGTHYSIHCFLLLVKCLVLSGEECSRVEGFSLKEICVQNLHCAKEQVKNAQEHREFWEGNWDEGEAGETWMFKWYEVSEPFASRANGVLTNRKRIYLRLDFL